MVSMLWFVGLAERAAALRRSALRAVSGHLMRMRHLKVKNLVTKVGVMIIGPQILGGLMTWLLLCLVMELGMMIGGGGLEMMVGAMLGQILLGVLFSLLPLRRLLPLPAAPGPKATSGAPVSAVTLEPVPTSKAKAKATSKAAPKASGSAIAALTLGSMFAGASSCVVAAPCPDVSLDGMLDGCVAFNDFSVSGTCGDSSLQLPTWELSPVMYHLPHPDELGCDSSLFHPRILQEWGFGHLDTSLFDPYLAEHKHVVASVEHGNDETWILFSSGAAANCCPPDFCARVSFASTW